MVVLSDHPDPPRERIPEYLMAFRGAPVPVDVFPFTDGEIARRRAAGDRFLARIDEASIELLHGAP